MKIYLYNFLLLVGLSLLLSSCGSEDLDVVQGAAISPIPVVELEASVLTFENDDDPLPITPDATVSDDNTSLEGGVLTFRLTGEADDSTFIVPTTPAVGPIMGGGGNSVSIALDSNATLATVEQLIESTTLLPGDTQGGGVIQVDLSDPQGNRASTATQDFEVKPMNRTVRGSDSIQGVIDLVAASRRNVQGSTVTVDPSYRGSREFITIENNPNLDGLILRGTAAGQSAGVLPEPRTATRLSRISVLASNVTIDGFEIFTAQTQSLSVSNGNNNQFLNCEFRGANVPSTGLRILGSNSTVVNCSFRSFGTGVSDFVGGGKYSGNAFANNTNIGLAITATTGDETINGNGFSNQTTHLSVAGSNVATASGNDFNNTGGTVSTSGGAMLNAQGNWWGADADPASPSQVNGSIDFSNRLTEDPFPAFP